MKIINIFFFTLFFASLSLAQTQPPQQPPQGWYKQQSSAVGNSGGCFFLNHDLGWVSFSDGFLGTTNGGNTWTLLYPFPAYSPHFIDANNGWAVSDTCLLRTANGGKNWQTVHSPVLGQMQIFGMDTIRLYNWSVPSFAGSNDGGKTWFSQDTGLTHAQEGAMSFSDSKHGVLGGMSILWFLPPPPAKGTNGAGFVITTDGGITWKAKYCSVQDGFHAIFAVDEKHIYTAGSYVYYTSDGGDTWKTLFNHGAFASKMFFFNVTRGYLAGGLGRIYFTNDTGQTWELQNTMVSSDLNDIFFTDTLTGWASGYTGVILHTTNAGKSWVRQNLPVPLEVRVVPEPFATSTTLYYSIPKAAQVVVTVYDITGKEVYRIASDGIQNVDAHMIDFQSTSLTGGTYYFILVAGAFTGMGKMTKITP